MGLSPLKGRVARFSSRPPASARQHEAVREGAKLGEGEEGETPHVAGSPVLKPLRWNCAAPRPDRSPSL